MLPTQEYQNGQYVTVTAPFRVYHNVAESIADHGQLLATGSSYQHAMADRHLPDAFAADLTGVYATDPHYGTNLIAIMKLYNLYSYSAPGAQQAVPSPQVAPQATAQPAQAAPSGQQLGTADINGTSSQGGTFGLGGVVNLNGQASQGGSLHQGTSVSQARRPPRARRRGQARRPPRAGPPGQARRPPRAGPPGQARRPARAGPRAGAPPRRMAAERRFPASLTPTNPGRPLPHRLRRHRMPGLRTVPGLRTRAARRPGSRRSG